MTLRQTLAELKRLGTAQNRKVYGRHGVGSAMYGVSYANQAKLARKIGIDQELAEELWASGNHDARILATKIADPQAASRSQLDRWSRDLENYPLSDALAAYALRTPHARSRMEKWTVARREWVSRVGWRLLGGLALRDRSEAEAELDSDAAYAAWLVRIEDTIHQAPNRVRDAMNDALICIGIRGAGLKRRAQAAARRIGPVVVDHGETGCKTPEAVAYIDKAWRHKQAKKARSYVRGQSKTSSKPGKTAKASRTGSRGAS